MNLILFEPDEINSDMNIALDENDFRAVHLKKILKAEIGASFESGIINGLQGKAELLEIAATGIKLRFTPQRDPVGLHPLTLILGLSRPPTVKKVLKEATALGIERFILCGTENGERSYIQSTAFKPENIRNILIEGASQAVCTQLPAVSVEHSLRCAIEQTADTGPDSILLALDNYEAVISLTGYWEKHRAEPKPAEATRSAKVILAVGSERGWTDRERGRLRDAGFTLCSLGPRVLRTETASIAGASVCLSAMGLI